MKEFENLAWWMKKKTQEGFGMENVWEGKHSTMRQFQQRGANFRRKWNIGFFFSLFFKVKIDNALK